MIPQQDGVPEAQLLPDRRMSIWNCTRLQDKRLWLDDDFILVHGEGQTAALQNWGDEQQWLGCVSGARFIAHQTLYAPDRRNSILILAATRKFMSMISSLNWKKAVAQLLNWNLVKAPTTPKFGKCARVSKWLTSLRACVRWAKKQGF